MKIDAMGHHMRMVNMIFLQHFLYILFGVILSRQYTNSYIQVNNLFIDASFPSVYPLPRGEWDSAVLSYRKNLNQTEVPPIHAVHSTAFDGVKSLEVGVPIL
jgi:hypothetical protein